MTIDAERVDTAFPFVKRYVVAATPPHGDRPWRTGHPVSRRAAEKKLYELGNHTADIAEAFAAADDVWNRRRT